MTTAEPISSIEHICRRTQRDSEYVQWLNSPSRKNDKADYANIGLECTYHEPQDAADCPDWVLATFSLVFPVPAAAVHNARRNGGFIELTGWERGRYHGTRQVKISRDNGRTEKFNAFYQASDSRFPAAFARSVGAVESRVQKRKDEDPKPQEPKFRFYQRRVEEVDNVTRFALTTQWSKSYDEMYERLADRPTEGYLSLAGVEFLQYFDNSSDTESGDERRASYFLVIHVVAQECTNNVLTQISEMLHRPRNGVRLVDEAGLPECAAKHRKDFNSGEKLYSLLNYFVDYAVAAVNSSTPAVDPGASAMAVRLTSGGFIASTSGATTTTAKLPRPARIACAIPGKDRISDFPRLFEYHDDSAGEDYDWAVEAAWAWQLATGADVFEEAVPEVTPENFRDRQVGSFHVWRVVPDDSNLAFVRQPQYSIRADRKFLMLASTSMVDIVILNLRCELALNDMQVALRTEHREQTLDPIEQRLDHIERVQRLALAFRRHLWFDAIGNRVEDTQILNAIQESSGNRQRFNDFTNELE